MYNHESVAAVNLPCKCIHFLDGWQPLLSHIMTQSHVDLSKAGLTLASCKLDVGTILKHSCSVANYIAKSDLGLWWARLYHYMARNFCVEHTACCGLTRSEQSSLVLACSCCGQQRHCCRCDTKMTHMFHVQLNRHCKLIQATGSYMINTTLYKATDHQTCRV